MVLLLVLLFVWYLQLDELITARIAVGLTATATAAIVVAVVVGVVLTR